MREIGMDDRLTHFYISGNLDRLLNYEIYFSLDRKQKFGKQVSYPLLIDSRTLLTYSAHDARPFQGKKMERVRGFMIPRMHGDVIGLDQ